MIYNALGGPVKIEKFIPYTVISAETGAVEYPEKSYFYSGLRVEPVPQSLLDEAYQQGYEAGLDEGKPYKCELEYIESTGTQYIDTKYALTTNNVKIKAKFQYTANPTSATAFGGTPTGGTPWSLILYGTTPEFYVGDTVLSNLGVGGISVGTIYDIDCSANNGVFTLTWNGKTYSQNYSGEFSRDANMGIFCHLNGGTAIQQSCMRLYSFQIYDDGTLVRDCIPVLDYNGEACLFDKVGKKFYYNRGTGTFNWKAKDTGEPYVYELEYIESTGTQYIDTRYIPNQNTRLVMDIHPITVTTHSWAFGARTSSSANRYEVLWQNDFVSWLGAFAGSYVQIGKGIIGKTDRLQIDFNKNICTINGISATITSGSVNSGVNLSLLACNTTGTVAGFISAKLYSCQIYENGELIRDYIPVLDYSGEACLYDKVNKSLYYNQGSGTFNYS